VGLESAENQQARVSRIARAVGVGRINCFEVGCSEHWELFVAGEPLRQVADAEGCAERGEAVVSAEVWGLVSPSFTGEERANGCVVLLQQNAPASQSADAGGGDFEVSLAHEYLGHQRAQRVHPQLSASAHEAHLRGCVHDAALSALDASALSDLPEQRNVVVSFCMVEGLDGALADCVAGLERVQSCFSALRGAVCPHGGAIRQFIKDDKGKSPSPRIHGAARRGLVSSQPSHTFPSTTSRSSLHDRNGLHLDLWPAEQVNPAAVDRPRPIAPSHKLCPSAGTQCEPHPTRDSSYEDNAERGLLAAHEALAALRSQGLTARIGVTCGMAFCGLVGAKYRCEYSVMGPSVNLAARLMCACEKLELDILCNDVSASANKPDGPANGEDLGFWAG
jgi:class 3 adenylate cyclase